MSMSLGNSRRKRVLGLTNTGHLIHAITGSEETEEERRKREANSGNNGGGSGGSNNGNNNGSGGDGSGGDGSGDGGGSSGDGSGGTSNGTSEGSYQGETREEMLERRLGAADRAKGEAERKLKNIEDKDKTDLERAHSKIAELEASQAETIRQRDDAIIQAEVLKFPGYDWQDPDVLLQLLDRKDIEIDEHGSVKGVKPAIEAIAKSKPYLLKAKEQKNDGKTGGTKDEHAASQNNSGAPASGGQPQNGKADDAQANRERLEKKYKLGVYA